jgi:diguanylate cyclase (GGDEF)-like protein
MKTPIIIRLISRSTPLKGESLKEFADRCGRISASLALIPLFVSSAQYTFGNTDSPTTFISALLLFVVLAASNVKLAERLINPQLRLTFILMIFMGAAFVLFYRHGTAAYGSLFLIPLTPILTLLLGLIKAALIATVGIGILYGMELSVMDAPFATATTLSAIALFSSWMTATFAAVILQLLDNQHRETQKALKKFKELSKMDTMTGVFNRRALDEKLSHETHSAHRTDASVSVAMVDIDYFKEFNDRYGHPEGDKAIQAVASVLSNGVHRKTDLVARYGGEEFAIVLPHTSLEDAALVASRLRNEIKALGIKHESSPLNILTVSIGVSSLAGRSMNTERIIGLADSALYESKHAGRNQVNAINDITSAFASDAA